MPLSEYADWWDSQKRQSEAILTEWVQENPQWWAVAIAGTVQTTMDLGAGFVDVLRFGEGMAQGGIAGFGKDALRLLVILGPLGRAGGMVSRFVHLSRLRLAVQVAGVDGPCTFQAVNNAMSILKGTNLFVTVQDMAAAMGKSVPSLARTSEGLYELGAWIDDLVGLIRNTAKVKEVTGLTNIQQVASLAERESGVVIFAIRATVRTAAGTTEELLHSVIAVRNATGAVRFADYGGKLVGSLDQLVTNLGYGTPVSTELLQAGSSATIIEGMKLTGEYAVKLARGAFLVLEGLTAIETPENGVEFAVPVAVTATNAPAENDPAPPEVVKGSFDAFKARKSGRPVIRLPDIVIKAGKRAAPRSDWLTGVQFRLNALGFGAGPVDGIAGPLTRRAVRAFQKAYPPLRIDAIPGPKTQAKLVEICGY
jgi:hypothetical protein